MKPTKSIYILLSLFLIFSCETPEEPDTTPPTVTITFSESSVNEIVSITCLSTDNEGVKKVELWVNGVSTGVTDETEPYSLDWNTTTYDDGSYVITVRSYDTSDNTIDSNPITLTVDNSVSYPQSVSINSIIFGDGSFTVTWDESTDSDFGSYELEKSVESTMSDYQVVYTSENVTDTNYVDTDVDPLSYLYYRVSVIDTFNYETKSQIVSSSLDPVPTSVNVDTVFYNLTEIKVEWEESIDGDFRDYKLLFSETESGDKDTVVTYTDKSTTSHIITSFNPTHENWYWILVSDTLGQSSIGDGMTHTIDSHPTQIDISSIYYDEQNQGFSLSWIKSSDDDFVSYTILESENESFDSYEEIFQSTNIDDITFFRDNISENVQLFYRVVSKDFWMQETEGDIFSGTSYLKIVFTTAGNNQVATINNDGTYLDVIDPSCCASSDPVWSNDGKWIVYMFTDDGLKKIKYDGTEHNTLYSANYYCREPIFSQDGERIYFHTSGSIQSINSNGDDLQTIWSCQCNNIQNYDLSPNGQKLTVQVWTGSTAKIYIGNSDGTSFNEIVSFGGQDREPHWSPNSNEIVFAGDINYTYHMFKTDGINTPIQLTNNYEIRNPRWSPNGTMLIAKGPSGIVIVNSDGTNETLLSVEGAENPRWNLLGDKILFIKSNDLYHINIDGSGLQQLTSTGTIKEGVEFQPTYPQP